MKEAEQSESRVSSSLHEKLLGASDSRYVASPSTGGVPGEEPGDWRGPPDTDFRTGGSL